MNANVHVLQQDAPSSVDGGWPSPAPVGDVTARDAIADVNEI